MINLGPAELAAWWVFEMGEPRTSRYTFASGDGAVQGRPERDQARQFVAKNFWACAEFFHTYLRAFNAILLGWSLEDHKQTNPGCLFGIVLARMWCPEESSRGGAHAHGLVTLPLLQARNLKRLSQGPQGRVMQQRILEFSEALACAMMPPTGLIFKGSSTNMVSRELAA